MKNIFLKGLLLILPFSTIQAQEVDAPEDQFEVLFGASEYAFYKVLDFAKDHDFRFVKILSFAFNGFDHTVDFTSNGTSNEGRFFELKDEFMTISFLCFEEAPLNDPYFIDLEKYQEVLDEIAEQIENYFED